MRNCGSALDEFFRMAMRGRFYDDVAAQQANRDAWHIRHNTERAHPGCRNQGRRPVKTTNRSIGPEGQEDIFPWAPPHLLAAERPVRCQAQTRSSGDRLRVYPPFAAMFFSICYEEGGMMHLSRSDCIELDLAIRDRGGRVPVAWVKTSPEQPFSNLGDALSPLVVTALTGLNCEHCNFDTNTTRLTVSGTIGQNQHRGTVHMWGTGIDAKRRAFGRRNAAFAAAPETNYVVHAVRGPHTRATLLDAGIHAPPIYGDPGLFLPRIFHPNVEKKYELGIILHLAETQKPHPQAQPREGIIRYNNIPPDLACLITTWHEPTWPGFCKKIEDILACKRIVSSSFHGMLLAESYGIPCAYFSPRAFGAVRLATDPETLGLDHRFADFFSATGRRFVPSYGQPPRAETPWDKVIEAIDELWEPMEYRRADIFLEAFPLRPRYGSDESSWFISNEEVAHLAW